MAYIGFNPSQLAIAPFATKYFTGDGVTTTFTLDQSVPGANEANVEVFVENVQQNPIDAYTIGGALNNQLIFSEAPVSGAAIYVIHKGEATYNLQPSTGSVTAATLDPVLRNFTVDKFTGNGSTTAFTLSDTPYSPNSILVSIDGIVQQAGTNYTVSGTTLTFASEAPDTGSDITVIHLGFSSGNKAVMDRSITPVKLSTGGPTWDTNGVLYIGPASPLSGATNPIVAMSATANNYVQTYVLNRSNGTGASADLVAYPDNGSDASGWIDMGITSSTFSSSTFGITGANEGYLFMSAPSGASKSGNLVIATDSTGTSNAIVFATGGFGSGTERMRLVGNKLGIGTGSTTGSNTEVVTVNDSNPYALGLYRNLDYNVVGSMATLIQMGGYVGSTRTVAGAIAGQLNTATQGWVQITALNNGSQSTIASFKGNGVVDLPYGQIKFPAVQNSSTDPNTLDDYEEGTWDVYWYGEGSNPTVSYAERAARYVKIGGIVFYSVRMVTNSKSGGSGRLYFNLPFSTVNYATGIGGGSMVANFVYQFNSPYPVNGYTLSGNNRVVFIDAVTNADVPTASLNGNSYFNMSGFFYTT